MVTAIFDWFCMFALAAVLLCVTGGVCICVYEFVADLWLDNWRASLACVALIGVFPMACRGLYLWITDQVPGGDVRE